VNNYPKKLNDLLENFSIITDQQERMNFLIDYADKFKEVLPEIAKRPFPEENKIPFCESGAYVWTKKQNDSKLKFYFAVENPQGVSAKALSTILDNTLSGEVPEEVLKVPDDLVIKIFGESLSMGKNMGLTGILQKIKRDAKSFLIRGNH
jgi:cysteine desulfuration protein SufE